MKLRNQTILITGAAGELGQAMALACATAGANIVAADLNLAGAEALTADVRALGRSALALPLDVCDGAAVRAAVAKAVATLGQIDGLINNAGVFSHIPFLELPETEWDRMFNIHVRGAFLCSQAVLRHMVEQQVAGSIVNISSVSGLVGFSASCHYGSAKAALDHMSRILALEFGPHGIRVNTVAPGTYNTRMNAWFLNQPESRSASLKTIPLGRFGEPVELADAVTFLLSPEARYITGATLVVDGGQITHI
jgi:NAD(P)-dependent dehydrogenase (short-subunit alcohol dehydrogenase family)